MRTREHVNTRVSPYVRVQDAVATHKTVCSRCSPKRRPQAPQHHQQPDLEGSLPTGPEGAGTPAPRARSHAALAVLDPSVLGMVAAHESIERSAVAVLLVRWPRSEVSTAVESSPARHVLALVLLAGHGVDRRVVPPGTRSPERCWP